MKIKLKALDWFKTILVLMILLTALTAAIAQISLESAPPVVVSTVPVAGADDVDPGLDELRVTFSKAMLDGSWSWSTWGQENFPEMSGQPRYLEDQRTCVLPVKLEPEKFYAIWLNSEKFRNFKDAGMRPAVPYLLTFTTASASSAAVEEKGSAPPTVVSVFPPDGAKDVATSQEIRIRFDRPMDPGYLELNWTSGGYYPNGVPSYSAENNEFVIPVYLTPGEEQILLFNVENNRVPMNLGFRDANAIMAKEHRWSFSTHPMDPKQGAKKPKAVRIEPASESATSILTMVDIEFDRPMAPPERRIPFLSNRSTFAMTPAIIPSPGYDPESRRVTLPVLLPRDQDVKLRLEGFVSSEGVESDPITLHYRIGGEVFSEKHLNRIENASQDPRLMEMLAAMKASRARLDSGIETVQTVSMHSHSGEGFNRMWANAAIFTWQGEDQIHADITGPMMSVQSFELGSDGKNCWLYSESDGKKRLDRHPAGAVDEKRYQVVDPFNLSDRSVAEAIQDLKLVYEGRENLDGAPCHRLSRWEAHIGGTEFAAKTEWWIDAETLLPKRVAAIHSFGQFISLFSYESLNEPIPVGAFQPPIEPGETVEALFKEMESGYDRRFIQVSDGSNGRMSGRMGMEGPKGRKSSGLN